MALTRDELVTFLRVDLGVDTDRLTDATPLLGEGHLDSVLLLSVFQLLQRRGVDVDPRDVTLEHFDSVARILAYANRDGA